MKDKPFVMIKNFDINAIKGNMNLLRANTNLPMGDITPNCFACAKSTYEGFLIVIYPSITLITSANMFALDTIPTAHVLNPCAINFLPFCESAKRNCVIMAILVTLLFLLV